MYVYGKIFIHSTSTSMCSTVTTTLDNSVDEINKLNSRIKDLESENFQLTRELQHSVQQSTKMLDQVMKLESSNERLKLRINQVKDYVGQVLNYYNCRNISDFLKHVLTCV